MPERRTFPPMKPADIEMFAQLIADSKRDRDLALIGQALLQQFGSETEDVRSLLQQIGAKRAMMFTENR